MNLAFFHGDPWVVLIIPLVLGIGVLFTYAVLFFVWLKFTNVPAQYLALAYLAKAAALILVGVSPVASDVRSIAFILGVIVTLPWSALFWWASDVLLPENADEVAFAVLFFVGALLNALIVYLIGKAARRLFSPIQ